MAPLRGRNLPPVEIPWLMIVQFQCEAHYSVTLRVDTIKTLSQPDWTNGSMASHTLPCPGSERVIKRVLTKLTLNRQHLNEVTIFLSTSSCACDSDIKSEGGTVY